MDVNVYGLDCCIIILDLSDFFLFFCLILGF